MPEKDGTTNSLLLGALEAAGVRYCHFKSNAHVAPGVAGLTDLDLLCDHGDAQVLEEILVRHGFKRFAAHASRAYPGVDDFLGVDEQTGRLLHLHLHYRLIVGERFFKNYRLPWEREFLDRRIRDDETGVFVADPSLEWLLLVCRAALKIRWRERILAVVAPGRGESAGLRKEHEWLAARVGAEAPAKDAARLLGDREGNLVARALADDLRFTRLTRLRRELLRSDRVLRAYGRLPALAIRWRRELRWAVGGVARRYLRRPVPSSRSGAGGGTIVAVIGSDGAGKSSIGEILTTWLRSKVDVIPIYFGSGQGRSSVLRWPLKLLLRLRPSRPASSRPDPEARRTRDVTFARAVWAILLAREKRSKLRTALRARERGFVVVCDRYPQTQVDGVNDGPLLWRWRESGSRLKRGVARWEDGIYAAAAASPPDVVVRLLVSPQTASLRRPGDNPLELEYRTELVRSLRFEGSRFGVLDVDADADLDSVALDVKRRLWPAL